MSILNSAVSGRGFNTLVFCLYMLSIPVNASSAEYKVSMQGWEFDPASLMIKTGDTVIWINNDDTRHKLSFEDSSLGGPTRENAHKFNIGENFSFRFTKVGEFKYTCITHEGQDMSGIVIVKD
ncbi:MAG: plastocyanin/azurin family copper-binding protein [Gammaproteobacteria bacterium]|nr:plastocyanin/azurin family copper-binding protein [Gammaproteobacteria bacterium]